jgi:uncharacterized protein (TIGR00730 family)
MTNDEHLEAESQADPHEVQAAIEPLEPASRRPQTPVSRPLLTTEDAELDRLVADIVSALAEDTSPEAPRLRPGDLELTRQMLTTVLSLPIQRASRAELKLVNQAVKELAYSFRVFAPYRDRRKVAIFGSARTLPDDPAYVATRDLAEAITRHDWMVITGAGPGIMAAGHEGASAEHSFGVNINLPFLNPANIYIADDGKLINFKYFFTRKVTFIKESDAFVLVPGGWGTLDEAFELLTLMQTGKTDLHPIVLLEPDGSTYWHEWLDFVSSQVLSRRFIHESDLSLFRIAKTPSEAVDEIVHFYRNYQSARFVGERLILRMKKAPDAKMLALLNRDFADLLKQGSLEVIHPLHVEVRGNDQLDLERLAFYPTHEYGRIRQLIDVLNDMEPEAA